MTQTARRLPFPAERRLVLDTLRLGRGKPMMHGLLELDVTRARQLLRERAARGEALSFTAFVLACVARAVAAHPEVHARRDWRGRLVLFDDVDIATIVEVEIDGRKFPLAHVVRAAQRRPVEDIHAELRAARRPSSAGGAARGHKGMRLFLTLPGFLRRLVYRAVLLSPARAKRRVGTLLVSAVGMFGTGVGWGLSAPGLHDLSLVVGGIGRRPELTTADAPAREVLCLTVSANHDLVDGAPLARFAAELARLVARAEGLETAEAASEVERAP